MEQQEIKKGVKQKNTLTQEEKYALGEQRYEEVVNDPRVKPIICNDNNEPYFVKVQNNIIRYICQMTNAQTAYLYLVLLSHRNRKTNLCIPSLELLAKECNLNVRSISRGVKALSDIGAISVNSGKQSVCSNYYFPFEGFYDDFKDDMGQRCAYKRTSKEFKNEKEQKSATPIPISNYDDLDDEIPF